jgi:3-isopropylmalate/(R)-2-methylmalate dehydratase small subunit
MEPFRPIDGIAVPIEQPNLDTDQVLPARYLQKPRANDFREYLFRDLRFRREGSEEPGFILNREPYRGATVLIAGRNFGCGSSREHAVWALYDYGFRAVIAPSFGDIFFSNALKNGLLPIVLPADAVSELLKLALAAPGTRLKVDLAAQTVAAPNGVTHEFAIDPFSKHCLLNGLDELEYTLSLMAHITGFERDRGSSLSASLMGRDRSGKPPAGESR